MSTWSRWQWYPPELHSEISASCPSSAAVWWLHRSAAYPCSLKRRHDYFLSADETEGAQASLSMSAMFIQITWGVPADRLGCIFMASLSQSRCRQQPKCVISPFPGTLGDVAAPSFALVLTLMCGGEQKVVWLETIAFCWVFRQSSTLNSLTSECVNAGGITRRHGKARQGAEVWVATISFSSSYYLNYLKTIMQPLSHLLFHGTSLWGAEYERSNALPGWAPSQGQIAKTNRFLHLPSGS